MNKKIRLILSDVDGTLLTEGTSEMNPELFEAIRMLKEKGIMFAAVSGRQYASLKKVFKPVVDDIAFISDNGACSTMHNELISCYSFEKSMLCDIIGYVREFKNAFILLSAPNNAYTESKDKTMTDWVRKGYKLDIQEVEDLLEIDDAIVKVAVFISDMDAAQVAKPALKAFENRANVAASGDHWVDFVPLGVDKGAAVRALQESLKISPEESMAFGDNHNDVGMLMQAQESYAVAGARDEVKATVKHVLTDESMDAVLNEIKRVFLE